MNKKKYDKSQLHLFRNILNKKEMRFFKVSFFNHIVRIQDMPSTKENMQ